MIEYTLELQVSNLNIAANTFKYVAELSSHEEDYPEQKFTPQFCKKIRNELQNKSSCKINQANLNKLIRLWIEDIKEGYRTTTVTMNLPTYIGEDLESINDEGNQQIPSLVPPSISSIEPKIGALPKLNFT